MPTPGRLLANASGYRVFWIWDRFSSPNHEWADFRWDLYRQFCQRNVEPAASQLQRDFRGVPEVTPDERGWRVGGHSARLHAFVSSHETCTRAIPDGMISLASRAWGVLPVTGAGQTGLPDCLGAARIAGFEQPPVRSDSGE